MSETEKHKKLKLLGRVLLKDRGYENTEIFEEHKVEIGKKKYVVDVCGMSKSLMDPKTTAVECGTTNSEKLINLKLCFDEVICLPYGILSLDTDLRKTVEEYMIKVQSLEKEIERLEKRIQALNGHNRMLSERDEQNSNLGIIAEALKRHASNHYYSYSKDDKKIMAIMSILEEDMNPKLTGSDRIQYHDPET